LFLRIPISSDFDFPKNNGLFCEQEENKEKKRKNKRKTRSKDKARKKLKEKGVKTNI
jgi:hypothetical protein